MNPDELKLFIRENYPVIWKKVKPWTIKKDSAIEVGEVIRDRLVKNGFRKISLEENIDKTLEEATEFLENKGTLSEV